MSCELSIKKATLYLVISGLRLLIRHEYSRCGFCSDALDGDNVIDTPSKKKKKLFKKELEEKKEKPPIIIITGIGILIFHDYGLANRIAESFI